MAIWLKPCPMCNSESIGVTSSAREGWVKFKCNSCGYKANYHHDFRFDEPFANAAQDFWNGGRHCEAIKEAIGNSECPE